MVKRSFADVSQALLFCILGFFNGICGACALMSPLGPSRQWQLLPPATANTLEADTGQPCGGIGPFSSSRPKQRQICKIYPARIELETLIVNSLPGVQNSQVQVS
jgi:hypothetical protein